MPHCDATRLALFCILHLDALLPTCIICIVHCNASAVLCICIKCKNGPMHLDAQCRIVCSLDFFAGVGGLALGLAQAGFEHVALVERNPRIAASLAANGFEKQVHQADVEAVDFKPWRGAVPLITGGPLCQPFSARAGSSAVTKMAGMGGNVP